MSRLYPTWQEDDAYRTGYKDASLGRSDMERTPRSFADYDSPDRAYWEGWKDKTDRMEQERRIRDEYYDQEYERWRNGV